MALRKARLTEEGEVPENCVKRPSSGQEGRARKFRVPSACGAFLGTVDRLVGCMLDPRGCAAAAVRRTPDGRFAGESDGGGSNAS